MSTGTPKDDDVVVSLPVQVAAWIEHLAGRGLVAIDEQMARPSVNEETRDDWRYIERPECTAALERLRAALDAATDVGEDVGEGVAS